MEDLYVEQIDVDVVDDPAAGETAATVRDANDLTTLSALVREQAARLLQQSEKLEAASYRIGYLESQIQGREEQIKLLTTTRRPWWQQLWGL